MSIYLDLVLKTLPSGPAAWSAPKNFSTESEKFSGAAPPHVTRGMEGFEIYIKFIKKFLKLCAVSLNNF